MQQNVGALDSTIRIGLAFGLMFAGFLLKPPASYAAFVGFLLLAISGFSGRCLLYTVLGVTTCPEGPKR
jgi:hypothetical protein